VSALSEDREPAPRDAQLIGLLRPFDLITKTVPREHRKQAKRRATEIAETGPVGSAVRGTVTEVQSAIGRKWWRRRGRWRWRLIKPTLRSRFPLPQMS